ncbi:hypothetical protein RCG23_07110 [Neobacillus sp. PS3-34]|uniref:hypothetical protein n=1 Tax=Neobacillus sp. PS3-34 TaxID=3070678 RepID=UPI0027DFBB07|nr:hypothetical protein [Neobacillus sp. PS3-34]WML49712.1 hypothetical protein RCG23_07110 [Neobacillus sp. PS3-34]
MLGIQLNLVINAENKDITEREMEEFYEKVIDLIESNKWTCGGGIRLVDVDEE